MSVMSLGVVFLFVHDTGEGAGVAAVLLAGIPGLAAMCELAAHEEGDDEPFLDDANVCAMAGRMLSSHIRSRDDAVVETVLDVVEGLAATATLADTQVLAWAMFDPLAPDVAEAVARMCGPATADVLAALGDDSLDPDSWAHESGSQP